MELAVIVAMAENRVIGNNQQIPWHLSADLKRFKQITMGRPIIMGRKTYESIGRPLPGRTTVIISRNPCYSVTNCLVFNSIELALAYYASSEQTVFVIGGAALYAAALPLASKLYLTQIHSTFSGDTFFPDCDMQYWRETKREDINDDHSVAFNYSFLEFEKI
ncbi:MAG: dihydrofolate reductase [Methylococcaceae bacterium]